MRSAGRFGSSTAKGPSPGRERRLAPRSSLRPAGIILGGFDAAGQQTELRQAQAQGIPVVGWHSGTQPGPDPQLGLYTNVTTDPRQVALLAASYVIADSHGTAGAVIFTDSEYAIATYKANVMASTLKGCRRCSVLQVVDSPLAGAEINVAAPVTARLGYLREALHLSPGNQRRLHHRGARRGSEVPDDNPINHRTRSRPATAMRRSSHASGLGTTRRRQSPSLLECKAGSSSTS